MSVKLKKDKTSSGESVRKPPNWVRPDQLKTHRSNLRARSRLLPSLSEQERKAVHLDLKNYLLVRRNVLSRLDQTDAAKGERKRLTAFLDYLRSIE